MRHVSPLTAPNGVLGQVVLRRRTGRKAVDEKSGNLGGLTAQVSHQFYLRHFLRQGTTL